MKLHALIISCFRLMLVGFVLSVAVQISSAQSSTGSQPSLSSESLRQTAARKSGSKKAPALVDPLQSAPATAPEKKSVTAPTKIAPPSVKNGASDAERNSITYTAYDLDIRLRPAEQAIAVRGLVSVRNTGSVPLQRLPIQISSGLTWESARIHGQELTFGVALVNSDADHTGQMKEALLPLSKPLAPGAELQVDLTYSGDILQTARRLESIGTDSATALLTDWDRISDDFTGLRGYGNVIWYPVTAPPALLGDKAVLFEQIGAQKQMLSTATFHAHLTVEAAGVQPNFAAINGQPVVLTLATAQQRGLPGIWQAELPDGPIGFQVPNLFVATRQGQTAAGSPIALYLRPDNLASASSYILAAGQVFPMVQQWLGAHPSARLSILDLPEPGDAPFEAGSLLVTPVQDASSEQLTAAMAHTLTHACFRSNRAWLEEGVAHFIGSLWMEKSRGRDVVLRSFEPGRQALALAEPGSPADGPGHPLITATMPTFYRNKAGFVLWMLRGITGDAQLAAALTSYRPEMDSRPDYFEELLGQSGKRKELGWFFKDWVYNDPGLPELNISGVYPRETSLPGSYLVAVTIENSGWAAAEVPITLRTPQTSITTRLVVPAHGQGVQRTVIQGKPDEVRVNDGTVPETLATEHVKAIDYTAQPMGK
jgi:hypothetical protein